MTIDKLKSFLKLKVVWKDDDMLELEVTASNGLFHGQTEVYDQSKTLFDFTHALSGFPRTSDDVFLHEAGEKDGYAYFGMRFYTIDNIGHIAVQVTLESNVSTGDRTEEKQKIILEILTEPSLLDNFIRSLRTLARTEKGEAILEGVSV